MVIMLILSSAAANRQWVLKQSEDKYNYLECKCDYIYNMQWYKYYINIVLELN